MANFNFDLDNYRNDLPILTQGVTAVRANGKRTQNAASTQMHTITISSSGSQVILHLQESGLYIKGFTNSAGTIYYFKEDGVVTGNRLSFSCGYVGTNSIGIFNSNPQDLLDQSANRGRASLDQAIRDLAAHAGGTDNALKLKLAMLVFLTSESIRFGIIYKKMWKVCAYESEFTFAEFKDYVQNWETISSGVNIPTGTNQERLYTWHS